MIIYTIEAMFMEKIARPRGAGKGAFFLLTALTLSFFLFLSAVPAHAAWRYAL